MTDEGRQSLYIYRKHLTGGEELALFGFEIPHLPDFLADPSLLAESQREKLEEVLDRFSILVAGFRKYKFGAICLRYRFDPREKQITTFMIGRIFEKNSTLSAEDAGQYFSQQMANFKIPLMPISTEMEFEQALIPDGTKNLALVEVRQKEDIIPIFSIAADAYVIYPYWKAMGSGIYPFEAILRQKFPVTVSVYLEPTQLTREEQESFYQAAHIADTSSEIGTYTYSEFAVKNRRDPGAKLVTSLYSGLSQRISDPFLISVQIVSKDPTTAWNIAQSYSSSMLIGQEEAAFQITQEKLPSDTNLVWPEDQREYSCAMTTFTNLVFMPWGKSQATPGKERLPFLTSANGATTAFRFPINTGGGVPGIHVKQYPPDFEQSTSSHSKNDLSILLGHTKRGLEFTIPLNSLKRHTLVTGFTGSGKTNTVLFMLDQIWRKHKVPFLVFESAKTEYRSLMNVPGFEDFRVFTLGNETVSPFRLNPFELLPGVRLEPHLGRLQTCFEASLPQFGILPSIIEEAMEEIYKSKGWKLTDCGDVDDPRLFPTIRDLFLEVSRVTDRRGYTGETLNNIKAATSGRIGSLLRGSRGRMFGNQTSYPVEEILHRPVILEMNDLNENDKALVMMFLLTWLREYRELNPSTNLTHVTVVEEAHNVLGNVQSVGASEVSADIKAKAVVAFSNMLSEIRSFGEGLIIADQSPEKLAPDAIRNTNLQLAHQLRDQHDRSAIARAMIMDRTQENYLGKLKIGEVAVYKTGLEKATFIHIPEYKDTAGFDEIAGNDLVVTHMEKFSKQLLLKALPFDGCRYCTSPCKYREEIERYSLDEKLTKRFNRVVKLFGEKPEPVNWPENWRTVATLCREVANMAGHPKELDAAYCYLAHKITFPFTEHMRSSFEEGYQK